MPIKVVAMAMNRQQFKSKVSEYLTGAIGEYLKSKTASDLGWPNSRYVGKWQRESRMLLDRLEELVENQPTSQKFDRTRVVKESLKDCTAKPMSWLGTTVRAVARIAREEGLPDKLPKGWGIQNIEQWLDDFVGLVAERVEG